MTETIFNKDGYVGYEYKEIAVDRDVESLYADGYPNFGWKLDGGMDSIFGVTTLRFKRDRKIHNKTELTRLQRQFESNVKEISKLEQSKAATAFTAALATGLVGTACLTGSVFALVFAELIPLMVVLAVPGIVGWVLPYFLYKKILAKKDATVTPLIEQRYDAIFEVCEKAHGLLAS